MTAVVVGGGIAGLVAARVLARRGEDVRLFEASGRVGGVIRTERGEGRGGERFLLELGPNTVRPTPELLALVRELGLEREMLLSDPRAPRYLAWRGRLHALPSSPVSLLTTPLLSPGGKLRLLAEPFVRRTRGEGSPEANDESVRAFFTRRAGREVADRFVAPFVSGIFAGDPDRLSAAATFPALVRGEREHGSLTRWGLASRRSRPPGPRVRGLMSFRDGLETLPRAIAAELGARVETGVVVTGISPSDSGWRVDTPGGTVAASRLVLACPAGAAARLVRPFAAGAADALAAIPTPPVAVLHFELPRGARREPLRGFGHLVVPAPGLRILGAVWSSSLFSGRAPDGTELLTAFAGGSTGPAAARLPDAELAAIAARELGDVLDAPGAPELVRRTTWDAAIPQYELGHETRIAELAAAEARWKGLTFLGSYRGGVSVGDVVRTASSIS